MINRESFYQKVRMSLFSGKISPKQFEGIEALLNEYERLGWQDLRHLAYIFCTVYHETAKTMQPVTEYGGEAYLKPKKYYPYYGRDLCQTTWLDNYKKVKAFTGIDVVKNPELIAELKTSVKVAFEFMSKGYYTGKKLSQFFNDKITDPILARSIINGRKKGEKYPDKAELIAHYYALFLAAL